MTFLNKLVSTASQFVAPEFDVSPRTKTPLTNNLVENSQNNTILKNVAANVAGDEQTDSVAVFRQEVEQVNRQKLSKTADRTVRVVFSKPAEQMNYKHYTRDYVRAMLRGAGVSKATDAEVDRFQALLKDATGDAFGTEDAAQQTRITERYRATQRAHGSESDWGTSPRGRALVLAGAGAIIRERAAAGARLGEAQAIGQQKETAMAADIPGALYEIGRKTADGIVNVVPDALNSVLFPPVSARTGSEPNFGRAKLGNYDELASQQAENDGKPPLPRLETSALKYEFKSEMLRRGVFTGKVDDGIKAGDAITTAASIAAPVVAGKVLVTAEAPQTLKSAGALPEEAAANVQTAQTAENAAAAKAAETTQTTQQTEQTSRVYRVQGGTAPDKISKHRIFIGEKGEMVVSNKETEVLFVTFDDIGRVKVYQTKNRPGSEVISFEVDPKLVQEIRQTAVPEAQRKAFPNTPINVDKSKTKSSFGLPPEWIEKLINAAKLGTGRIDK